MFRGMVVCQWFLAVCIAMTISCGQGAPGPAEKPAERPVEKAQTPTLSQMAGEFARLPDQDLSTKGAYYPAYIKGKVLFVYSLESGTFLQYLPPRGDDHLSRRNLWAHSPEEVSTVLVADCSQLERAGDFVLSGSKTTLPAYDRLCVESVVDRTIPSVIFRRTGRIPAYRERSVRQGADRVVAQYSPYANSMGQIADKIAEGRIELRD